MLSVKELIELAKKGLTVELQLQLMALQERELELREENLGLKDRVKNLEFEIARSREITFDGGKYWLKREMGLEGPFCQRCYDANRKLIRLQKMEQIDESDYAEPGQVYRYFACFECKNNYDA